MKKVLSILMVLTLVGAMLVGCSKDNTNPKTDVETGDSAKDDAGKDDTATTAPTEGAEEKPEEVALNVAYMPNYASLNSVVAGIQMGYFEEQGIKVNLVEFADGPTIIAAMESGSIDLGYIGPGAHKLAIEGRATVIATSHFGNADEVIGIASKGVNKIEDLKGKKIAIASGTSSETILDLTLKRAGLTKEDVTILDMDASAIVTAMISGSVDACATWSPNTFAIKEALGEDAVALSNNVMFIDESPSIASWIVNPSYAKDNADIILRFTKALYKAMDYRAQEENIDQVVEWVADQVALDVASVNDQRGDGDWMTSAELIEMIESGALESAYQVQQDNFLNAGNITEGAPVSDYVMFQNMLDAAK